jgi:hypothetical protein
MVTQACKMKRAECTSTQSSGCVVPWAIPCDVTCPKWRFKEQLTKRPLVTVLVLLPTA